MTDASGAPATPTSLVWASGAPAVATVDANGLVSAVRGGTAIITATATPVQGTAAVTVVPIPDGKWSGTTQGTTLYLNIEADQQGQAGGSGTLSGAQNASLGVSGTYQAPKISLTCTVNALTGGSGTFVFIGTLSADGFSITGTGTGAGLSGATFTLTRI